MFGIVGNERGAGIVALLFPVVAIFSAELGSADVCCVNGCVDFI